MTFFKHLGHKSSLRHKSSGSSAPYSTDSFDTWFDTWLAEQQESELEDTSHRHSGQAELADSSGDVHVRQPYIERRAGDVYEMEDNTTDVSHDKSYPSWNTQEVNQTFEPCELDIEPLATGPRSRAELASPETSFSAIGAQFEDNLRNTKPREEMLVSPISTVGGSFNYQSAAPITSHYSELESPNPIYKIPNTVSMPEIVDHRGCHDNSTLRLREPSLASGSIGNFRDAVVLSTQTQIEDLRDTVGILNEEWLRRCQSIPDLSLRASIMPPESLLEKGARTLQLIYQGVLPCTFDAMFALAHFACAAAYLAHGDDSSHSWNEFFQHILNLESLLDHENDARLFIQLVNLLFLGLDGRSLVEIIDSHTPQLPRKPTTMAFLHSLKSSAVFQECSRFLDGKLCLNYCLTGHG